MERPLILPGMKEPDDFSGCRIDAGDVGSLVQITLNTSQGQIRGDGPPAVLARDHMLNLKWDGVEFCGYSTILAKTSSPTANEATKVRIHSQPST